MSYVAHLTQSDLKELLDYDPETGLFVWRKRDAKWFAEPKAQRASIWNGRDAGKVAGTINSIGYREIKLIGKCYKAHRLAWLFMYGEWPAECIDHINHIRTDNRISNLRVSTVRDNNRNQSIPKNNNSGFIGVRWYAPRGKWAARIGQKHLGYFSTKQRAVLARRRAEAAYGYHDNHGVECAV